MPKISILCPSRERAGLLRKSLASLGDVHEVLVRVDDDDPELERYKAIEGIKLVIGERLGYERLNVYINELAEQSTGDWLMLWNDDAIMETENWQELIGEHDPELPCVLNPHKPQHNYFPLISREFYKRLGEYSPSPNSDSYVAEVARICGVEYDVPGIEIKHLRGELDDATEANSLRVAPMMAPIHEGFRYEDIPNAAKRIMQ